MFKRIEEKLDNSSLLCSIVFGLAIAIAIVAGLFALASIYCMIIVSAWWVIGCVSSVLACGMSIGVAVYISENCMI